MPTVNQPRTRSLARLAVFVGKLGIAVVLLGLLYTRHRFNAALITHVLLTIPTVTLCCTAAVAVLLGLLIMSWRFQQLLRHVGFSITFREALGLTFIGSFTGAVLPGLIGGDIVKAVYLCRSSSHQRSEALSAVMVDRLIGLYGLISLAALALLLVRLVHPVALDRHLQFVLLMLWGGATLAGLLLMSCPWRRMPLLRRIVEYCPHSLRDLLRAIVAYCATPRLIIVSVGLSIINHLLVVSSFWIVGRIIGDSIPFLGHIVLNPPAMLLNAIPLTPGGVGITESGFSLLFQYAGSPNGATIGLLGRIVQYLVFALGGIPALLALNLKRVAGKPSDAAQAIKESMVT